MSEWLKQHQDLSPHTVAMNMHITHPVGLAPNWAFTLATDEQFFKKYSHQIHTKVYLNPQHMTKEVGSSSSDSVSQLQE